MPITDEEQKKNNEHLARMKLEEYRLCYNALNKLGGVHCTAETKKNLKRLMDDVWDIWQRERGLESEILKDRSRLGYSSVADSGRVFLNEMRLNIIEPLKKGPCDISKVVQESEKFKLLYKAYSGILGWIRDWLFVSKSAKNAVGYKSLKQAVGALRTTEFLPVSGGEILGRVNVESRDKKTSGARWGERCTVLDEKSEQTTHMVKQGNSLGETLAEHLAYLEYQAFCERLPDGAEKEKAKKAVAKTQLWLKSSDDPTNAESRVCVASEYHKSACTLTASELGGYKTRPKMVGSRDLRLIPFLTKLNEECGLGLEHGLQMALREGDYDLHVENVLLVVEAPTVFPPNISQVHFDQLVTALKQKQEAKPDSPGREDAIISIIKSIQMAGGTVFFQKIDHGNSYANDTQTERLSEHKTSPVRMVDGRPTMTATNHAAEFVKKGGNPLLFSDTGCDILLASGIDGQKKDIEQAAKKLFVEIAVIAGRLGREGKEEHLLKALYQHVSGGEKYKGNSDVESIQQSVVETLCDHREDRVLRYEKDCQLMLGKVEDRFKTSKQTILDELLQAPVAVDRAGLDEAHFRFNI